MYDFYSILDEMSIRTQRKAGFSVDLVRVGMWYEFTIIRFQGMFEGFIHRHKRQTLLNSRTLLKIF